MDNKPHDPHDLSFDTDHPVEYRIIGFSPVSPEDTLSKVLASEDGIDVGGDFVLVASGQRNGDPIEVVVTSPLNAVPYYYAEDPSNGCFAHGKTVHEVVESLDLPWEWDTDALANLIFYEHPLGRETLHKRVRHFLPGCVSVFDANGRHEWFYLNRQKFFTRDRVCSIDEVIRGYGEMSDEALSQNPLVSLSSGFDSRLILAHMLHRGVKPKLLTMGPDEAFDVEIARQIAKRFGLEHQVVRLSNSAYLDLRQRIVTITGGAKTAKHWHTYLYVAAADIDPTCAHYIGSNGAFAKTNGMDFGVLAHVVEKLHIPVFGTVMAAKHWEHLVPNAPLTPMAGTTPRSLLFDSLKRARTACPDETSTVGRLNEFELFERLNHYNAQGNALVRDFSEVRAPFVDIRLCRLTQLLSRQSRLGCTFHRAAIAHFCPELLDFPVKTEDTMARRPPIGYAWRRVKRKKYTKRDQVTAQDEFRQVVMDNPGLDALIDRATRERVMDGPHTETKLLLLTLGALCELNASMGIS